jgi:hypothetical protein
MKNIFSAFDGTRNFITVSTQFETTRNISYGAGSLFHAQTPKMESHPFAAEAVSLLPQIEEAP